MTELDDVVSQESSLADPVAQAVDMTDTQISPDTQKKHVSWKKSFKDPEFRACLVRIVKTIFKNYPVRASIVVVTYMTSVIANVSPPFFLQKALVVIQNTWQSGNWAEASGSIFSIALTLGCVLGVGLVARTIASQVNPTITQGTLQYIRNEMYSRMESLPVRYFDEHEFGDIMSYYTNDVDTMRQLISFSLIALLTGIIGVCGITFVMLYFSVWMTLIVFLGAMLIFSIVGYLGANSGAYFKAKQDALGKCEGFAEEAMAGQRTIKVFVHEQATNDQFDALNEELFKVNRSASRYMNLMEPVLFNSGNILYVFVAIAGSWFIANQIPNLSISGATLTVATVIPFLNMTKSFTGQMENLSQGINPMVSGIAAAKRIFALLDQTPEQDAGYVELIDVNHSNAQSCGCKEEKWAWKHTHADGTTTYTPLKGEVVLEHVSFGYNPDHMVLHDINLTAHAGQKIAFVGATGAGKTTITNLLNRFYDINAGKIRYDGINIEKIKKADLRKSLGMVLQDTHLFSDTVLENIRFGRLEATDEECIEAAKLAGADSFIVRLPEGYDTYLEEGGSSLSQGQRQLISIARAAVANPPVMILDEATSSIDTRTESLVQRGMDNLMDGRTTFVIAHRLSTVRNADLICVLDHGRIIEEGTHQQLLALKGTYYQLYTGAFELE